jgi:hypothetical protein
MSRWRSLAIFGTTVAKHLPRSHVATSVSRMTTAFAIGKVVHVGIRREPPPTDDRAQGVAAER